MFAAHDVIGAAVGLAGDDGDLGHGGFAVGVEQLGAVGDDAAVFLGHAGQKAGHVYKGDDGDVECVAKAHKAGRFFGRVNVQHAGQDGGLLAHDAHRETAHAGKADDDVARVMLVDLEKVALVYHVGDDVFHVIRFVGVVGHDAVQGGFAAAWVVVVGYVGRVRHVVLGHKAEQATDAIDAVLFALGGQVGHAALAVVRHGPAQFLKAHFFARDGLDDFWAGDEHVAGVFDHKDKVGHGRRVDGAPGARPHDGRYLGNHARGDHVAQKDVGIGAQADDAFLDARSARIVQADDGRAVLERQVHDLAHFFGVYLAQAAAKHGKVLGKDVYQPPLDGPPAGDDAVGEEFLFFHAKAGGAVGHKGVQLAKAALV